MHAVFCTFSFGFGSAKIIEIGHMYTATFRNHSKNVDFDFSR